MSQPDPDAWRTQVRQWLATVLEPVRAPETTGEAAGLAVFHNIPEAEERLLLERCRAYQRARFDAGYQALTLPRDKGGAGLTAAHAAAFAQEESAFEVPPSTELISVTVRLVAMAVSLFGTAEQRHDYARAFLRTDLLACQLFSEPDAGSDLANIKTTAVRDGDSWRITGQKVWTSLGHIADWIFVICRTDPKSKQHRGLSFLLCPMDQPGVEVRPIRQLTGTAEFNEVFFDGASTPADMVVGAVDDGWRVVMGTLGFERGTAFLAQQLRFATEYRQLVQAARGLGAHTDPLIRQRLAQAYVGLEIMRWTGLRTVTQLLNGRPLGPEASIGKLHWSRWHQQLGQLAMDVHGASSLVHGRDGLDDFQYTFQFSRAHTIYAGSSEIQRNIIGERVLGLPKEPTGR
jgi:alkylation response protein AidB-like acyl-CoA dehydrogenase